MELWIRSQDRENLLKTDIVAMEEITENEEYWIYAGHEMYDPYRVFAVYHSKERALEVLDEIQNLLKPLMKVKNEFKKSELTGNCNWEQDVEYVNIPTRVYEMPQE